MAGAGRQEGRERPDALQSVQGATKVRSWGGAADASGVRVGAAPAASSLAELSVEPVYVR